jgi:hypothetical protein
MSGFDGLNWSDLKAKGFLHVEKFLTPIEVEMLLEDYRGQPAGTGNHNLPEVSQKVVVSLSRKLREASEQVRAATGINADMNLPGMYFAIERGIKFAWHQDYESYYSIQQHYEYLNFYIPIVKPDSQRTNLCVVPFDRLLARIPDERARLVGVGAQSFFPVGDHTRVSDDENGIEYTLPVNIEELQVTPRLQAGDLLLMRGDLIHRTEDAETERIAVSFRRTNSSAIISKARILSGCPNKRLMMSRNPAAFGELLECFAEALKDEMTARQLFALSLRRMSRRMQIER